jgi:hypothetical protein
VYSLGKKRKLAFEDVSGKHGGVKGAAGKQGGSRANKARVEVEYELEEEGERVPAQLRILAAQAAEANTSGRGGSRRR